MCNQISINYLDFEKRIAEIYQTCRTQDAIQASFDALQASLSQDIEEGLSTARQKLLEHFDAEVAEKLVPDLKATAWPAGPPVPLYR